jgi:MOSC domain
MRSVKMSESDNADRDAVVVAVSCDHKHRFSKTVTEEITLLAGLGVQGDAHAGTTVQHRSRVASDPTQPNLRQVHLISAELHAGLRAQGFDVSPGQLGENVLTAGVDLLALPRGTLLQLGEQALVQVTGLRNPCVQIDAFKPGLLKAVVGRDQNGDVVRKAGVMSIVVRGGPVRPGDSITVRLPTGPHRALKRV